VEKYLHSILSVAEKNRVILLVPLMLVWLRLSLPDLKEFFT